MYIRKETKFYLLENEICETELAVTDGVLRQFTFGSEDIIIFPHGNKDWVISRGTEKFVSGEADSSQIPSRLPRAASLHVSAATTEALTWKIPKATHAGTLYCCFLKLQEKYKCHFISNVEFIISTVNDSHWPVRQLRSQPWTTVSVEVAIKFIWCGLFSKYSWVFAQIRTCFWLHCITRREISSIRKINRLNALNGTEPR